MAEPKRIARHLLVCQVIGLIAVWALSVVVARAADTIRPDGASTRPAVTRPSPPVAMATRPSISSLRPGAIYMIQRYKRAVGQINLTDDEKIQVDAVFQIANLQGLDLSRDLDSALPGERNQKIAAFGQQIHKLLAAVLTAEEIKSLDQKLSGAASPRPGGQGNGPAAYADNIEQALDKLDLPEDKKKQAKSAISDFREKLTDIRKGAAEGGNVQQELQEARADLRQKLQSILTREQLRQLIASLPRGGARRPRPGAAAPASEVVIPENKPADLDATGPDTGSAVPNVQIIELNGRAFVPSQYQGHVVVLEFGSMSCPVFRAHAAEMERLRASESGRAFFMIVYTREAFPAGEKNVERNRDEGISVAQAKTIDERKAEALDTERELRITIPMAIDSMDDAVSNAFGGFPNGCIVIGKDSKIAARQQWTTPDTLRGLIDDAANAPGPKPH